MTEKLNQYARGATRQVTTRAGRRLGMWHAAGYPKSGTTWLGKMMGTALDLPFPIEYQVPIMKAAVIHSHWTYDPRLPHTIYIRRDGRDVAVSMYFFWAHGLKSTGNPSFRNGVDQIFTRLYGAAYDVEDVRANLPKFIEYQMTVAPTTLGVTWQQHVADWWDRPEVGHVRYEGLLADPVTELWQAVAQATGSEPDKTPFVEAAEQHAFSKMSGRDSGVEGERSDFLRKGISGDWLNHFTPEAARVFDHFAGEDMVRFGYAEDRTWVQQVPD